jgi:hypothetical protein
MYTMMVPPEYPYFGARATPSFYILLDVWMGGGGGGKLNRTLSFRTFRMSEGFGHLNWAFYIFSIKLTRR